jgi:hypothetical protein
LPPDAVNLIDAPVQVLAALLSNNGAEGGLVMVTDTEFVPLSQPALLVVTA